MIGQALPSSSSTASAKPKITIDPSPKQKRSISQIKRPEKSKLNFIEAKSFKQDTASKKYVDGNQKMLLLEIIRLFLVP